MPVSTIDDLPAAGPLAGTEPIETVQGGVSKRTTAQDIADLGGGGGGAVPLTVYAADATMAANAIAVANFANAGGSAGAPITISLPAAPADGDICEVWSYDPDASGEYPGLDGNGNNITAPGGSSPVPALSAWSSYFVRFDAALNVWLCPRAF